jgi:hypothetical protein
MPVDYGTAIGPLFITLIVILILIILGAMTLIVWLLCKTPDKREEDTESEIFEEITRKRKIRVPSIGSRRRKSRSRSVRSLGSFEDLQPSRVNNFYFSTEPKEAFNQFLINDYSDFPRSKLELESLEDYERTKLFSKKSRSRSCESIDITDEEESTPNKPKKAVITTLFYSPSEHSIPEESLASQKDSRRKDSMSKTRRPHTRKSRKRIKIQRKRDFYGTSVE